MVEITHAYLSPKNKTMFMSYMQSRKNSELLDNANVGTRNGSNGVTVVKEI